MEKTFSEDGSNPTVKMAIIGMDVCFGPCDSLDAFERSIYDGSQHFIPLPPNRWNSLEGQCILPEVSRFNQKEAPIGAYVRDFDISLPLNVSSTESDQLDPQQLLMLKVVDGALKNSGIPVGGKVAVLIAMGIELSEQSKESPRPLVGTDQSLARRISSLWNFTGPSKLLSGSENAAFKALEIAQRLLSHGEVEAVLVGAGDLADSCENVLLRSELAPLNTGIPTLGYDKQANGWMIGEGAGAVVLKLHETAKQEKSPIYAVIDGVGFAQPTEPIEDLNHSFSAVAVTSVCQKAFDSADISSQDIGYVEVFGSGIQCEDEAEICGLIQAYSTADRALSCGLGSVKANIGHTYGASGMASLIKTALCLYHRYIPAVPKWSKVKDPMLWQEAPFYIASESRPWLLTKETAKRVAAINGLGQDGTYAHIILSEESEAFGKNREPSANSYLEQMPLYLFPIAADDRSGLLEKIDALQKVIEDCSSLAICASKYFVAFQKHSQETYVLVILGRNKDELIRELQRAVQGVAHAFVQGTDWKTPLGSYFTAKPLGRKGTVAYAYPGAFGSYVGLGRDIFRLFPGIWDNPVIKNTSDRLANISELLYPRSLNKLSIRQLETIEKKLLDNISSMLEVEVGFATLITAVMKDYFQVQPHCVFGYSLGETSMLCAQGVWTDFNQESHALNSSPLFETRLSGPKNAVREYWGLPQSSKNEEDKEIWSTYVLITSASEVANYLKNEKHVYLTQINTPKEVVIAGKPEACKRVIKTLNCDAFRAPLNHAIHCEAMRSEYDELVKLNTLPIQKIPEATIYSTAEYEPLTLAANSVSHHIAKGLCQPLDFPRLVNRIYEDGNRIFIEAGAGSICSRWINEILGQKEHTTISLNRRGTDDFTSIARALAQLLSHRVPVDISPLYHLHQEHQQRRSIKSVSPIDSADSAQHLSELRKPLVRTARNRNPEEPLMSPVNLSITPETTSLKSIYETKLIDIESFLPQELNVSSNQMAKAHSTFLQKRQESLEQIAEIIQLQVNLAQHLLHEMSEPKNQQH